METTRTPATVYKFTASIVYAIQFILQMMNPVGKHIRLRGVDFDDPHWQECELFRLPSPDWLGDFSFTEISASPIKRFKRIEPTKQECGAWLVKRGVYFYKNGAHVATLVLEGMKPDRTNKRDNAASWTVSEVQYAMKFRHDGSKWVSYDWKTYKLEVMSYTGLPIE